jgi:signal transduction histidine kinase
MTLSRHWVLLDVGVAIVSSSAIALEVVASTGRRGPALANLACCLALAGPLALRRRVPLAAASGVIVLAIVETAFLTPLPPLVTPLALAVLPPYAIGAHAGRIERSLLGLATCVTGGLAIEFVAPAASREPGSILPGAVVVGLAWVSGRFVAARTARMQELERLADALVEATRARERLAIAEQRAHVARELHDLVAHSMTVICLQAGAAQRVWDSHPGQAQHALAVVGSTARETLAQLRDALDLLDPNEPPAWLRVEDMEALALGARAAGLNVSVRVDGPPRALPGAVGLVAYRIVQEALTNAIRHAAPTDVAVCLAYESRALAVHVRDFGRRPGTRDAVTVSGTGNGLRGMRERVEILDGVMSFGALPAGGFAIAARLPLELQA